MKRQLITIDPLYTIRRTLDRHNREFITTNLKSFVFLESGLNGFNANIHYYVTNKKGVYSNENILLHNYFV